jgi:hypothetical protein
MHHGTVCVDLVLLFYNGLDGTRATVSGHAHWTPEGGRTHAILELFQPGPKKELDPSAARERTAAVHTIDGATQRIPDEFSCNKKTCWLPRAARRTRFYTSSYCFTFALMRSFASCNFVKQT